MPRQLTLLEINKDWGQIVRKVTPKDSHLGKILSGKKKVSWKGAQPEQIQHGIYVFYGMRKGNSDDFTEDDAKKAITPKGFMKKTPTTKGHKFLELFKLAAREVDNPQHPTFTTGAGRGGGLWVRYGPFEMGHFDFYNITGMWEKLYNYLNVALETVLVEKEDSFVAMVVARVTMDSRKKPIHVSHFPLNDPEGDDTSHSDIFEEEYKEDLRKLEEHEAELQMFSM